MEFPIYQIDAFSDQPFTGNPAAVIPLLHWLPDETLQAIAQQNNLSETAFYVSSGDSYSIRWFTPTKEVKLCGHATLATAWLIFNSLDQHTNVIQFNSLSGLLSVKKHADELVLDFPKQTPHSCDIPSQLVEGLGITPLECLYHDDLIAVFEDESQIERIQSNSHFLKQLDYRGVIATAPAKKYDFVVRFFAPKYGIEEDSVTGSAYTQLAPYWAEQLNKSKFIARQLSKRGGDVSLSLTAERVLIAGKCRLYLQGFVRI